MKKIALNKETLRKLNPEDLSKVAGGYEPCPATTRIPCRDSVILNTYGKFCF